MTAPYNVNQPIEIFFKQITAGVLFAALEGVPFMSKQIVKMAVLSVEKTGVFIDNLKFLNRKPANNQMWQEFKIFFAKAHREWKSNLLLTTG